MARSSPYVRLRKGARATELAQHALKQLADEDKRKNKHGP